MKKKNKKRLTEKQKKLIKLITENLNSRGFTKTMKDILLEAGYSESTARRQQETLNAIKDETEPITNKILEERDAAVKAMKGKRKNAKYRDLVDAVDKLTKAANLLGGKPTEVLKIDDDQFTKFVRRKAKELDIEKGGN